MYKEYSITEELNEIYGLVESLGWPVISRPTQTKQILKQQNFEQMTKIKNELDKIFKKKDFVETI